MSQLVDAAPARQAHDHQAQPIARPTRVWALLEALGYAGALIDPTGVLAAERFRRAEDQQRRHGRR
jgi:hypothetical protein